MGTQGITSGNRGSAAELQGPNEHAARSACPAEGPAIFTVGHSTLSIEAMIELLRMNHVDLLVDVRTVPRSRHNPQFSREAISESVALAGIEYRHEAALGGFRHPLRDSANGAWRNDSFRGFADYMRTSEFNESLDSLLTATHECRIALMCAEGNPFRCHRSLIADAIAARGLLSCEITSSGRPKAHRLTPFAHIEGGFVTYPVE